MTHLNRWAKMKTERNTTERVPLAALEVIEDENRTYRRNRFEDGFFVVGVVSAIVSSILRWPFYLLLPSTIAFFVWIVSLIIYSEVYRFYDARSFPEVLGRIRDDKKEVKCIILFLAPVLCRILRILVIIVLSK